MATTSSNSGCGLGAGRPPSQNKYGAHARARRKKPLAAAPTTATALHYLPAGTVALWPRMGPHSASKLLHLMVFVACWYFTSCLQLMNTVCSLDSCGGLQNPGHMGSGWGSMSRACGLTIPGAASRRRFAAPAVHSPLRGALQCLAPLRGACNPRRRFVAPCRT